jgi:hypothetical protein
MYHPIAIAPITINAALAMSRVVTHWEEFVSSGTAVSAREKDGEFSHSVSSPVKA